MGRKTPKVFKQAWIFSALFFSVMCIASDGDQSRNPSVDINPIFDWPDKGKISVEEKKTIDGNTTTVHYELLFFKHGDKLRVKQNFANHPVNSVPVGTPSQSCDALIHAVADSLPEFFVDSRGAFAGLANFDGMFDCLASRTEMERACVKRFFNAPGSSEIIKNGVENMWQTWASVWGSAAIRKGKFVPWPEMESVTPVKLSSKFNSIKGLSMRSLDGNRVKTDKGIWFLFGETPSLITLSMNGKCEKTETCYRLTYEKTVFADLLSQRGHGKKDTIDARIDLATLRPFEVVHRSTAGNIDGSKVDSSTLLREYRFDWHP